MLLLAQRIRPGPPPVVHVQGRLRLCWTVVGGGLVGARAGTLLLALLLEPRAAAGRQERLHGAQLRLPPLPDCHVD
jgi:hypothetical protein